MSEYRRELEETSDDVWRMISKDLQGVIDEARHADEPRVIRVRRRIPPRRRPTYLFGAWALGIGFTLANVLVWGSLFGIF